MGIFSDILEANRERGYDGYIDPCMIMSSFESNSRQIADYHIELKKYNEIQFDYVAKEKMRQEFMQKSAELEKLKVSYLVAEKIILEIINRGNIESAYMKDLLNTLQSQLRNAYRAICQLRSEIDKSFKFEEAPISYSEKDDIIREDLLDTLISTTLHHMEEGLFCDTSTFRKVVSDCAEIIRCLKKENYRSNDKSIFSYYLVEHFGLKSTQYKCCNCGKPMLNNLGYCLNCYERNM